MASPLCSVRLIVVTVIVLACGNDEWHGFVYPGGAFNSRDIGTFPSLEACRSAARAYLHQVNASGVGDYECGLNCRVQPDYAGVGTPMYICKETLS